MTTRPERWFRFRFKVNADDPRPVVFPPHGPYWVTGYSGDMEAAIVVAYIHPETELKKFWPDAHEIEDGTECKEIIFSERFPKPDWWSL